MSPVRVEASVELSVDGKLLRVRPPAAARALLFGPPSGEPQARANSRQRRIVVLGAASPRAAWEVFTSPGEVEIFALRGLPLASRRWLERRGELHVSPSGASGLAWVLSTVGKRFRRVAWGGGTALLRALAGQGFLSHLDVRFMPEICGGANSPTLLGPAGAGLLQRSIRLRLVSAIARGGALRARYAAGRGR